MEKATSIFKDKVLLGADYFFLGDPINQLNNDFADQLHSVKVGYSFLYDGDNATLHDQSTRTHLFRHICSVKELCQRFFGVTGTTTNLLAFSEWMHDVSTFVGMIAVLIHLSAGQPTRGTEFTSATLVNNQDGGMRSLFWCQKTLMLGQYYSKSETIHGDKHIGRFLPKPLANLVVAYLALVRPFEM